jgi:hypothetical protein
MSQCDGEQTANIREGLLTAVSEIESLRNLLREQGLVSTLTAPSAKSQPPASTGLPGLDALLGGGIPRGQITELIGPASSGRTSVALAILAEATARGEVAAYIDASDSLDPRSAQKTGIVLERLLWVRVKQVPGVRGQVSGMADMPDVRCGKSGRVFDKDGKGPDSRPLKPDPSPFLDTRHLIPDTSSSSPWKAVNLVASAGGFGVILLDLGGIPKRKLREWQSRQWLRLRRAIEHSPTALVLLASEHLASSVSALVIEIAREKTRWEGVPGVSLHLSGISAKARVAHQRKGTHRVSVQETSCKLGIGD